VQERRSYTNSEILLSPLSLIYGTMSFRLVCPCNTHTHT